MSTWTLVTVTHDSAVHLEVCWRGVELAGTRWVVVDNASTDASREVAAELGAEVVALPDNVGFSRANNIGLAMVRSTWVGFVNPDVTVDVSGLNRLEAVSRANGALVAPQLVYPDGTEQPNARGLPFLVDKVAHRAGRLPGARLSQYRRTGLEAPTYTAWVMGAALAGSTAQFRRLGGWDESFFLYYEDHDIGLRAWRAGMTVVVDPEVRWVHQWQRATTTMQYDAWRRELASAWTFFRRYPHLLSRGPLFGTPEFGALGQLLWSPARDS